MKTQNLVKVSGRAYTLISILSLAYVSFLSLYSPQATMDLVSTALPNTDALSSIRGIYGGVGLVICLSLVYLLITDLQKSLLFLAAFWFAYAISRLITIWVDGPLGDFGSQWLVIESIFCVLAAGLFILLKKIQK